MNFLTKIKNACGFVPSKLSALLMVALVSLASAATDYTALSTAVSDNLSGLGTVLMTVAGTIIGIVAIVVAFRFIRGMLR